jgi:hypothetical protein
MPTDVSSTPEQISADCEKGKQQLAESFAKGSVQEFNSFCLCYRMQLAEAEK